MTHKGESASTDQSWAVAQTIHRFLQHIDDGQMEQAAGLFTPEGCWVRLGNRLVGPQAVLQALRERPASLRTRHLATNMVVTLGPAVSRARYYLTVFDHEGPADAPGTMQLPHFMFVCEDNLIQTEDGWRFELRQPKMVAKR